MIRKNRLFPAGAVMRGACLLLAVLLLGGSALPACAEGPEEEVVLSGVETEESVSEALPPPEEDETAALIQSASALFAGSAEDVNYLLVEKTFLGLPEECIPEEFRVTVTADDGTSYTLSRDNTLSRTADEEGNVCWRWKLSGVGTGRYTVSEAGETVPGYTVTGTGAGTVEVRAADMTVLVPVHETTCSHTNWPVRVEGDDEALFAATLTQGGVAVISRTPLSASQRAAVSQAVLRINGPWKTPVYFYSIEEQLQNGTGFELNGATITYDDAAGEVIIGKTRNWQHVATLKYLLSEADTPEIALKNVYTRAVADVTVRKTVAGNMADADRAFAFTVSVTAEGGAADFTADGTAYTGEAAFSLRHGESVHLEGIPVGARLTVTEADCTADRYAASCTVDGAETVQGPSVTIPEVTAGSHLLLFTNRKDVIPDTGVRTDRTPELLLLGFAAVGASLVLLRRIRREARP